MFFIPGVSELPPTTTLATPACRSNTFISAGLVILAGVLVWTPSSRAADLYVSPAGTGTACTSGSPCPLSHANQIAVAGDRVLLAAGTYASPIDPAKGGTSGNRITYMGAASNPTAAVVPAIQLGAGYNCTPTSSPPCGNDKGDHVTVKWVKSTGNVETTGELSGSPPIRRWADSDSIIGVTIAGSSAELVVTSHRAVISGLSMTGSKVLLVSANPDNNYAPILQYGQHNKLVDCEMTLAPTSSGNIWYARTARFDTLLRCRTTIIAPPLTVDSQILNFYNCHDFYIADSYFEITNNGGNNCKFAVNFRDSTSGCLFVRDTFFVQDGNAGRGEIVLANSGTVGAVANNQYEGCVFRNDDQSEDLNAYKTAVVWQDGIKADRIQFCMFICGSGHSAIQTGSIGANTVLRHNTFFTTGDQAVEITGAAPGSGSRFVSNALYTWAPPTASAAGTVGRFDRSFAFNDSNLYFCASGADSAKAVWNGTTALSPSGYAGRSFWRTPSFRDSTCSTALLARPDLGLRSGSWAVGPVWVDGRVGARLGPPWRVTQLSVTSGRTTAVIEWPAPPRVSTLGASYDLRRWTAPLTESNFADAYPVYSGNAGALDSAECAEDRGLDPCTTYHYALKTADPGGVSDLSNVPTGKTACSGSGEISCDSGLVTARGPDLAPAPTGVELTSPRPLPTVHGARFDYAVPNSSAGARYDLAVLDASGRRVRTLGVGVAPAGRFGAAWDLRSDRGARVAGGVYFLRLAVGETVLSRRLVVLD